MNTHLLEDYALPLFVTPIYIVLCDILSLESISVLIIFHGVVLLEICTNIFVKEQLL